MGEFLKGWRRKTGAVLLVVALILMSGWIRSGVVQDVLTFSWRLNGHRFMSMRGRLVWFHEWEAEPEIIAEMYKLEWQSHLIGDTPLIAETQSFLFTYECDQDWRSLEVPYWVFVTPVLVVSACLILWKPRRSGGTGGTVQIATG